MISFVASSAPKSQDALTQLSSKYLAVETDEADVIVAIGGDGHMLEVMHKFVNSGKPIYGINCGTVGFLMNNIGDKDLIECINSAIKHTINPLEMIVTDTNDNTQRSLAFNEVSLLRNSGQAIHLKISVQDKVRLEKLVCDGALVCTPAGSTAYNLSAHGPVLPIHSKSLALTPISPFTPRRWRGAILPMDADITFEALDADKRPVIATADNTDAKHVKTVHIKTSAKDSIIIMTDAEHDLEERIIAEQFM